MKLDDPRLEHLIVDGALILVPTEEGWDELGEYPEIEGQWLGSVDQLMALWRRLEWAKAMPDFKLGLYQPLRRTWLPIDLLWIDNNWQRIQFQNQECTQCGWKGETATPFSPDLYIEIADRFTVLKSKEKYPLLNCPRCSAKFRGEAIWINERDMP